MIVRQLNSQPNRWRLAAIAVLALALRLGWILLARPDLPLTGGDQSTYLRAAKDLAEGGAINWTAMLAIGPLYPFFLSWFYRLLPEPAVVTAIRVTQAGLDTVMCLAAFDLGRRIFNERVGWLAAGLLAIDLRFITQAGVVTTETFFIFLLVAGVWAFVVARKSKTVTQLATANVLLLLAAFTRAIALPIPLLLIGSWLLPKPSRQQLWLVGGLIALVAVSVAAWSVYQHQATGQWVLISDGFGGNFWMGSHGDGQWHGSVQFQNEIEDLRQRYNGRLAYLEDAFKTITADPLAYGRLLITKSTRAYLQPYGTVAFPGESLKQVLAQAFSGQLSLLALISSDHFWPKLYIYVFHFFGLVGGLIGLWLARREWLKVLPLSLPIVYITVAYTVLTIIPRYLFPIMPFYLILAVYSAQAIWQRLAHVRKEQPA
jgi:4-amino-4-deoxy-L-arabinose transferase-like glycosyltransferase